ncbi:MAG: hypothetical protein Q8934_15465 [Bacillota bacterium]|nr:hypothetical protein [Bacillota bacterium]
MIFKKKSVKEVEKELLESNYDLIIVFIGYTLILLGIINGIKKVPEQFLFGATLAGLFFTASDFNLLKNKVYNRDIFLTV